MKKRTANLQHILTKSFEPTELLLEFLTFMHIKHDGSYDSIVQATQQNWLNADKKNDDTIKQYHPHSDAILIYAKKLGMLDEIPPSRTAYHYCIIFGSDLNETRIRMRYAYSLLHHGIRFNHLICLGSERTLDPHTESIENLLLKSGDDGDRNQSILPKTEYAMMQWVYKQLNVSSEFKSIPITFINTPMQEEKGVAQQPNTADTLKQWLSMQPSPKSCLFISNQPFIYYQETVAATYMPQNFEIIEACGPALLEYDALEILDTLARLLFQINGLRIGG